MNHAETIFNGAYEGIGATVTTRIVADQYANGILLDKFGATRKFGEKLLDYNYMSEYFTVTVGMPPSEWHGRRGELWESTVQWLVTGYANHDRSGLAALVVCNFQALQDFVFVNGGANQDSGWIKEYEGGRFLRVPVARLLHDRRAANVVVTYTFSGEAAAVYRDKAQVMKMSAQHLGWHAKHWSDEPVSVY